MAIPTSTALIERLREEGELAERIISAPLPGTTKPLYDVVSALIKDVRDAAAALAAQDAKHAAARAYVHHGFGCTFELANGVCNCGLAAAIATEPQEAPAEMPAEASYPYGPPADAKEWTCPKCGKDVLWCGCFTPASPRSAAQEAQREVDALINGRDDRLSAIRAELASDIAMRREDDPVRAILCGYLWRLDRLLGGAK